MATYNVIGVWVVDDGKTPLGGQVLDGLGIRGLEFAYADGQRLTVTATVRAGSAEKAVALVTGRIAIAWQSRYGMSLGAPVHSEARPLGSLRRVAAGLVGRGETVDQPPLSPVAVDPWPDAETWDPGAREDEPDDDEPDDDEPDDDEPDDDGGPTGGAGDGGPGPDRDG